METTEALIVQGHGPAVQARWQLWLVAAAIVVIGGSLANAFILPLTAPRLELSAAAAGRFAPLWSWTSALSFLVPDSPRTLRATVIGVALIGSLALVVGVVATWRRSATRASGTIVIGATLVAWIAMTLALPTVDSDIFSYMANGRVGAAHGANPELVAPIAFPTDPVLPYTSPEYRTVAGDNKLPLWTDVTVALAGVAGEDPLAGLLVYRGLFLVASVVNLALIWLFLKRTRPDLILAGLVLYGWNPIILATGVSKVDTLMATLTLASLVLLTYGRARTATVALTLSVLVKLITLPLLVVRLGSAMWRRDWRGLGADVVVIVVVGALVYAPFWAGPGELAGHAALLGGGTSPVPSVLRPVIDLLFICVVVIAAYFDDNSPRRTVLSWASVLLFFGAFLTTIGLSWYLITMIAITAVAGDGLVAGAAIALSVVSFLFDRAARFEIGAGLQLPGWLIYLTGAVLIVVAVGVAFALRRRGLLAPG